MAPDLLEQRAAPLREQAQASRSLLVDAVRGIAIILVVLGHTNQGVIHRGWWGASTMGARLNDYLYSFHMPAFFFVSGIFLKNSIRKRGPLVFVRERFFSLIWPYLLWSCITALALVPLAAYTVQGTRSPREFAWLLVTGRASWFLPSIFFALLLTTVAQPLPIAVTFALSLALSALHPATPFVFVEYGIHFLPFLIAGMWVGPAIARLSTIPRTAALLAAVALGIGIAAIDARYLQWLFGGFLLAGFAGTAMLFLVSRCLRDGAVAKALAWAGSASLAIFLLSEFPQGAGRALLVSALRTTRPLPHLVVPTLLAVALPAWLYHRRYRLRLAWMFEAPFGPRTAEKKVSSLAQLQ